MKLSIRQPALLFADAVSFVFGLQFGPERETLDDTQGGSPRD